MAYATQADIQEAIGAQMLITVSDRDGNGTVDAASVTSALAEATSLVDSYLAVYLPLTTVTEAVRRATVDIAIHRLRIGTDSTTEDSRLAYQQAIDWLKLVASGVVTLPGGPTDETADPGAPEMEADAKVWTRATGAGLF